ncbi:hypothetical protein QAD02_014633 [Eretmocerus hayati]|uniref:Uncharacterized protein n=1 Tax=Eretmocerus hayati TaxID=131215 RepID=A0ACC2P5Z6_9HYME|nr:hypothetical protein QAD02_014633 [Eretmocerus hayati]
MSSSASKSGGGSTRTGKKLGCIGKCTSGLSPEELDLITDHIHRTLSSLKGRAIFRRFLEQQGRSTDLSCLDLYEQICGYIEKERAHRLSARNPTLEHLKADVDSVLNALDDLEAVEEIDLDLLRRLTDSLDSESREDMLACLEEVKNRLMNYLGRPDEEDGSWSFRRYVKQPCPKT